MGKSVPVVCFLLFCFSALEGDAQKYEDEPANSAMDNKQASQGNGAADQQHTAGAFNGNQLSLSKVNPLETPPTNPLPSNSNNARLKNVLAYRYRGAESDGTGDSSSTRGTIAYKVTIAAVVGVGVLIALGFLIKCRIKKMKQTSMQEQFSMTCHDTRLSSQFLSDFSETERKEKKPSIPPQTAMDKPIILDIIAATPPIPSSISLTSPKGKTKKSIWEMDSDFVRVDVSDREMPRKTSSLPSLTPDPSSSSTESRDSSRRDAVLLCSDDEDLFADLKKKRKKQKKTWKKIMKAGQPKTS